MKLQCELCREIVVGDLAIDAAAGVLAVHCPACDGRFEVKAAARSTPVPAPTVESGEAMTCPKCGTVQRPADACRACGLRADRMAEFAAALEPGDAPGSSGSMTRGDDVAPALAEAWAACEAAWGDPAAHERLAQAVAANGAWAWAARRYRAVLRARPDDKPAADRLTRLTRMTEASLRAGAAAPGERKADPAKSYGKIVMVLLALVLLAAAGALIAMLQSHTSPPAN